MVNCQTATEISSVKNILAVDDSPDNLLLIETLLEDIEEYHLTCVSNGPDALKVIKADPPDLVLLDVMMPDMDGYEVTNVIRTSSELPFIPILLLTAHRQADVATGLDAGADDFIRKPFKVDELMARVRALLRLKQSIDQQNKIMRQRDDFVARLTHDLRTPLIATNRVLDFCRRGTYGEDLSAIETHLSSVIENNEQLLHMVNSLLEVYRYEANRKKLTLVTIDVRELIGNVIEQLRPLAEAKKLELLLKCSNDFENSGSSNQFMGDRIELIRVITNLVGNAIKFTKEGHVHIKLDVCPADEMTSILSNGTALCAHQYYVIEVQDTGVGIPSKDLPTIFDWFRPGAHVNSGSGLGLHLAKRIIELHQGLIRVQSVPGEGSSFLVYLPITDTLA